jgi:SAM-dependent methyltransferase
MSPVSDRKELRECGDDSVEAGRGPGQLDWYRFASTQVDGKRVLDVGCGLGHGLQILQTRAGEAEGQDLDVRLAGDRVRCVPIETIDAKSYDIVTAIDVVEHVPDPQAFVRELGRIARETFFLTTPNWTASRCQWPFHLREYTPREFVELLEEVGRVRLLKGTPGGSQVYPVRHPRMYYLFNDLRTWTPTSIPARVLNNVIPADWRIHSHNAAWVDLPPRRAIKETRPVS